ncbi:hypothetical protein B0H14DRAFT_3725728 [Mycena olivaceomarginata]|nr:hypothetical protein B0H14DRAFT_3725728 [Mycena olivaceomarginata]
MLVLEISWQTGDVLLCKHCLSSVPITPLPLGLPPSQLWTTMTTGSMFLWMSRPHQIHGTGGNADGMRQQTIIFATGSPNTARVLVAPEGFHGRGSLLPLWPAGEISLQRMLRRGSQLHWEQLLSYGWYPVTPDNPQSAITIAALKLFHSISLQGETTVYHFFNALAKITDNTGSKEFKRNLHTLKRGGMGNDPDRHTAQTHGGELAVDCITYPKVGVNLPDGWEKAPVKMGKKISSWLRDPSIQDGWAYFVRSLTYKEFVKTLGEQTKMSTCTGLAALDHANTKYSQGYTATGCSMVSCGRHEIVCKNGVGDLQAGEKYGNMDYIWSKNLKERLLNLPPLLWFQITHYFVKFVIPKMHILNHLKFCQDFFSLLFTLGAAQADMKGIERIWSSSGLSMREMGLGSHQDILDDFWHYWNRNKVVGMGSMLRKHLLKAKKELVHQTNALQEFTQAQQGKVSPWKTAVDDLKLKCRQSIPMSCLSPVGPTLREIELELVCEEQECERSSAAVREATDDTMIKYLMLRVEIEGQQRQLSADLVVKRSPTTRELTNFVTRRMWILRQIKKLQLMQRNASRTAVDLEDVPEAERTPLFLPSGLSPLQATPPLSVPEIAIAKARLRNAQCSESLEVIRHSLIVKRRLQTYKTLNSRCQHQNTRSRTLVDGQQRKIDLAAATYQQVRTARLALVHAAGPCSWCALEKQKGDLRLPEDEEEAMRHEGQAEGGAAGGAKGLVGEMMHEGMRVEWSKAYARMKCWREEEHLLQEEMVRCLITLKWQAIQWDQCTMPTHYMGQIVYSATHVQGTMALAARQAAGRRKLASRFCCLWCKVSDRVARADGGVSSSESSYSSEQPENQGHTPEGDEGGDPEEHGSEGDDSEEDNGGDVERRRDEMDELLAIRTTSLIQYDKL